MTCRGLTRIPPPLCHAPVARAYDLTATSVSACSAANVTAQLNEPDSNPDNDIATVPVTVLDVPCPQGVCCNPDGSFKPSTFCCR